MAKEISKQEAVKRALKHFGKEGKPKEMQPWIKQEFGIEMTTDHISNAKSVIRAASRKRPTVTAIPQRAAAKADTIPASRKAAAIPLVDILYIKELVHRVEPGAIKTLIDAFTK
jgi:hypothetical protein